MIRNRDEAQETIKEIATLTGELAVYKADADERIARIRDDLTRQTGLLERHISTKKASLEEWAQQERESLMDGKKSCKVGIGTIGFRASVALDAADWGKVLKKLKAGGHDMAINVKESVNKAALRSMSDADLKKIGVRRESRESFYVNV